MCLGKELTSESREAKTEIGKCLGSQNLLQGHASGDLCPPSSPTYQGPPPHKSSTVEGPSLDRFALHPNILGRLSKSLWASQIPTAQLCSRQKYTRELRKKLAGCIFPLSGIAMQQPEPKRCKPHQGQQGCAPHPLYVQRKKKASTNTETAAP